MTDLQKIELEMLKSFVSICDELGLTYYLVCGSALGAIKYKGFIPWDDDLDVALPRADYEKFCSRAQDMLPKHLFLQTYYTDPMYPNLYGKLRDCRTTLIENSVAELNINHGVYIDIFPLDGYPESERARKKYELKKDFLKLQLLCAYARNSKMKVTTKVFWRIERIFGCHKRTKRTLSKLSRLLSSYDPTNSSIWCNHGNWQRKLEYAPREQYGEGSKAIFEGLQIRVPEKCNEYLTQKYGNWREDLPEEQKVSHHQKVVVDLEKPYTFYLENNLDIFMLKHEKMKR